MLKAKTEELVKETKKMMNESLGLMFTNGAADMFKVNESDDPTVKLMTKMIALSNQCFDLTIAQAEQLDEMNEKLDRILINQK